MVGLGLLLITLTGVVGGVVGFCDSFASDVLTGVVGGVVGFCGSFASDVLTGVVGLFCTRVLGF